MNLPKWVGRRELDNEKDEKDWANRRGGRVQLSSGRFWFAKRDVKDDSFLTDCKETQRGSFTIQRAEWEALTRHAHKEHLIPCYKIKFVSGNAKPIEVIVLPAGVLDVSDL